MLKSQTYLKYLGHAVDIVNFGAQWICYRLLELIVCVTVMQVVLRFGFNNPTKWSEEASMISLVWFGMLAVAIGVRRHNHIAITFFRDLLPRQSAAFLDVIAQILIFVFALVLIVNGSDLMAIAGKTQLPASGLPKYLLYLSAMVGGGLMALNAMINLITGQLNTVQPATLREAS